MTLETMGTVRKLDQDPNLGELHLHAPPQIDRPLSPMTCGRILALDREHYDPNKPTGPTLLRSPTRRRTT